MRTDKLGVFRSTYLQAQWDGSRGRDASTSPATSLFPSTAATLQLSTSSTGESSYRSTNLLLAGICDVSVLLKERTDVKRLATPQVPMNRPVKGKLEGTTVERPL